MSAAQPDASSAQYVQESDPPWKVSPSWEKNEYLSQECLEEMNHQQSNKITRKKYA
jgi:hypothetical protein